MSAYYGDGLAAVASQQERPMYEPWETTPWWHVSRWFGYSLRRYCNHPLSGGWDYGKPKQVARQELARRYDEQTNTSGTGPWRQGKASWHRPDILR